ncbi:MAG: pimelyl-ACP methyl ester esterase BioV [Sulfurimonas sp.]|nr:pimelyl-ACP methyl ester esterase BioV [Sulfurimonas sp.]
MKFYSGFSLQNEEYLFKEFLKEGDYTISGFSYGAIKALAALKQALENKKRVDTLQLFSPAFFQTKDEKFKRLQLMSYKKNRAVYLQQFLKGCFLPYESKIVQNIETKSCELEELLMYVWDKETLEKLVRAGVKIEVYLGGKDSIIDVQNAREFFLEVATVTYIKEANHFLQL